MINHDYCKLLSGKALPHSPLREYRINIISRSALLSVRKLQMPFLSTLHSALNTDYHVTQRN